MTSACALVLLGLTVAGCNAAPQQQPPPCTPRTSFEATGFFHLAQDCGRHLLVAPDGKPLYSTGVNHVSWDGDYSPKTQSNPYAEAVRRKYGTEDAWADATAARLGEWGWNTVGSWSSYASLGRRMPYTVMLSLAGADWQTGKVPDYFSDEWAAQVAVRADKGTAGRSEDARLLGYWIDNELRWGPDWRGGPLFDDYAKLGATAPGKKALVALLRDRHGGEIARFNAAWGTRFASFDEVAAAPGLPSKDLGPEARADRGAFLLALGRRFFQVTVGAIRARDPHHLVLGVRLVASLTPLEIAQAAGEALDVVSVNSYEYNVSPQSVFNPIALDLVELPEVPEPGRYLEAIHLAAGRKPLLVSEFGFRAKDSGLPNSWPPFYPTLATQAERADRFAAYARRCIETPWIVGHHWFEWADQPAAGRFDGEDNNWGLVTEKDEAYEVLVDRSRAVHAER